MTISTTVAKSLLDECLMLAVKANSAELVDRLLDAGANPNSYVGAAFVMANRYASDDIKEKLRARMNKGVISEINSIKTSYKKAFPHEPH